MVKKPTWSHNIYLTCVVKQLIDVLKPSCNQQIPLYVHIEAIDQQRSNSERCSLIEVQREEWRLDNWIKVLEQTELHTRQDNI